jgi:DNA-binding MarR family transcriptional regulator
VSEFVRILDVTINAKELTLPQVRLLLALFARGTVNQLELAEITGIGKEGNSKNIKRFGRDREAAGFAALIETVADDKDIRFNKVRLTNYGKALVGEVAGKVMPLISGESVDQKAMQH